MSVSECAALPPPPMQRNSLASRFGLSRGDVAAKTEEKKRQKLAQRFKYQENCSRELVERVRRELERERDSLEPEARAFWTPDFERMMRDDWLVSRFLLRGAKAAARRCSSHQQQEDTIEHTMRLVRACAKFRLEHKISALTRACEFPLEWTQRDGLLAHGCDRAGNPVAYLRVSLHQPHVLTSESARHTFKRMLLYTLELCDQRLHSQPGKAICCVFDMSNARLDNVDLQLFTWMVRSFKSCSPKLLAYALVYNLPWFLSATFKLVSATLMSSSDKRQVRFVYAHELLDYIELNELPAYLRKQLATS